MMTTHPSLLDADQDLLKLLADEPRQSPQLLTDSSSIDSKPYVQNRLRHLRDHGFVTRATRGIYELTARGERAVKHIELYDSNRDEFWNRVE